jgi:hypothetical protein
MTDTKKYTVTFPKMPTPLEEDEMMVGKLEAGEWCMTPGGFVGLVVDAEDGIAGEVVLSGFSAQLTHNLFGGLNAGEFRLTAHRCPGEDLVRRCEPLDISLTSRNL